MVTISLITPPKIDSTAPVGESGIEIHLGPLILEQSLRNQGFNDIHNYDLIGRFNGKMAMIMPYDKTPNFEHTLYGHEDMERCITSTAADIEDSDLYLISLHLANHTAGIKLAQQLKRDHWDGKRKKAGYIFVGGVSVAETTNRILAVNEIDAACYGYGEDVAPQLAYFVQAAIDYNVGVESLSVVPNMYVRDKEGGFHSTPFTLPKEFVTLSPGVLTRELGISKSTIVPIVGAYGCEWGKCNYCYLSSKPAHYYKRDMEKIVNEIALVSRITGVEGIDLLDEAFLYRINEFLAASHNKPMPRTLDIYARPNQVLHKSGDLERLIKEFRGEQLRVYLGVESFDSEVLKGLNRGVDLVQTKEAIGILIDISSKYEKFHFDAGFFLWSLGQTREGLLKGIELWEQVTRGGIDPTNLLKTQRYNIFANPLFAERTRMEFDKEMTPEDRKLSVTYPYGRSVFMPPLSDIYQRITEEVFLKMPFPTNVITALKKQVPSDRTVNLSSYGKRLFELPYETAMRVSLRGNRQNTINTVIGDIHQLWRSFGGNKMDKEAERRLFSEVGNSMLEYI
jgi:hypothetical protein